MGAYWRLVATWLVGLALAALLFGCPATRPAVTDADEGIAGQVFFPSYRTQATFNEVATAATVSLIDPISNETKATSLTDSRGRFSLSFRGLKLGLQPYYLEASKGLNSNAVGQDVVRVRTVIQRQAGGWTSLSSLVPGGPVFLNTSTTAVSLISSLRAFSTASISVLLGTVQPATGGTGVFIADGTAITQAEFLQVHDLSSSALAADADPFASIRFEGGVYSLKPGVGSQGAIGITYLRPTVAAVGDLVTLNGLGFAQLASANNVTFTPEVPAVVTTASPTLLQVRVPAGATSGPVSVRVGVRTATISFTVMPPVSGGLSP